MKIANKFSRVDIQVSILTAFIVFISFLSVYYFNYTLTYRDMITSLNERAVNIHNYIENKIDKASFYTINSAHDQYKPAYQETKALLENIKEVTGVKYLYTAKRQNDGSFVYVVDGLNSDNSDFRNAGDLIEVEIWADMERALTGKIILPAEIKETAWGYIFISYFPVYDKNEVVGVLGIEFDAGHQYNTFQFLRFGTPLIGVAMCLFAILIAVKLFKRISNPTFKDIATTDYLTNLKNRNAFEIDFSNLNSMKMKPDIAIISVDLNDLKYINDTLGHEVGDRYIQSAAQVLRLSLRGNQTLYRVGGDEYLIIVTGARKSLSRKTEILISAVEMNLKERNTNCETILSLAIGVAVFDAQIDVDFHATMRRADEQMYKNKREMKESQENEGTIPIA